MKVPSSSSFLSPALAITLCAFLISPLLALAPAVHHPLDALTPEEYWMIYKVLHDAGKLEEKTTIASVLLREPPKSEVLAWRQSKPIVRKADVVLMTAGKSFEVVVNISAGKVETFTELKGAQAPVSQGEMHGFNALLMKDPRLLDALKQRGITDMRLVFCTVQPAGFVALPEQTEGRRIGWGGCFYVANALSAGDREIPGIFFVVDMNEKKIVRFSDYGAVPMPPPTSIFDYDGGPAISGTKPILTSQPEGPSFTVQDGEVTWQNWQFRFRLDPRVGPV
jgi:primary-amine oxidase